MSSSTSIKIVCRNKVLYLSRFFKYHYDVFGVISLDKVLSSSIIESMKDIIKKLASILNLSSYEARVYLAALNSDKANLSELAQKAGIPRTAAYPPIQTLVKRGLLSIVQIKKRKYYQALNPKQLKSVLQRKMVDLDDIVSELSKNITVPDNKLSVSYFPGTDGIQIASDIWLENARTKLGKSFESVADTIKLHSARQLEDYVDRRVKKGIHGRMIIPANANDPFIKKRLEHDKEELRESIIVSPQIYPIEASVAVLDDMILMFTSKENPFAVLIKNKELANTMSSVHDMVWDRYKT